MVSQEFFSSTLQPIHSLALGSDFAALEAESSHCSASTPKGGDGKMGLLGLLENGCLVGGDWNHGIS